MGWRAADWTFLFSNTPWLLDDQHIVYQAQIGSRYYKTCEVLKFSDCDLEHISVDWVQKTQFLCHSIVAKQCKLSVLESMLH